MRYATIMPNITEKMIEITVIKDQYIKRTDDRWFYCYERHPSIWPKPLSCLYILGYFGAWRLASN